MWEGFSVHPSFYHRLAVANLSSIMNKMASHPSDRKIWALFSNYLAEFTNDPKLLDEISNNEGSQLEGKLQLEAVKRISPDLIHYLRLKRLEEKRLANRLRRRSIPMTTQSYWIWYFLPIDSVVNEEFIPELAMIEDKDPLWFLFLMENEKLSDFYSQKTGKAFLPGKRQLLRKLITDKKTFMPALWKLIELGDIDQKLVNNTASFLSHE